MAQLQIRIGVQIETRNGTWLRLGDPFVQIGVDGPQALQGFLSYPDRRVKKFVVFCAIHNGVEYEDYYKKEFSATASDKANVSFAYIYKEGGTAYTAAEYTDGPHTEAEVSAMESSRLEMDANLILVSEPYQMRHLRGQNSQQVGNDSEDVVVSFVSAAEPVSTGQFGEFPLFALCKNSAYAMQVGEGDIAFSRVTPLMLNRGALSRLAVAAIDKSVVFASREGIFSLPSSTESLSAALENSADSTYKFVLDTATALHYFVDDESGRRELWVATDGKVYAYALDYGVWFTWQGERLAWARLFDKTIGLGTDGVLYEETSSTPRSGKIVALPVDLEMPEILKRFRRVYYHFGSGTWLHVYNVTDYSLNISMNPVNSDLMSVSVEFETRYEHRPRYKSDLRQ